MGCLRLTIFSCYYEIRPYLGDCAPVFTNITLQRYLEGCFLKQITKQNINKFQNLHFFHVFMYYIHLNLHHC